MKSCTLIHTSLWIKISVYINTMLPMRRLLMLGLLHVTGGMLKRPDFNSGWLDLWIDENSTESVKILNHGFLETPLLVDVQFKESETGTIYQASGHIIQNRNLRTVESKIGERYCERTHCRNNEPDSENGVMYVYNDRVVKVIAITRHKNRKYGKCKFTAELPNGLIKKIRVRAWKSSSLPPPCFKTTSVRKERLIQFAHGVGGYPELVISRIKYAYTYCKSFRNFYSDSIGTSAETLIKPSEKTGYVAYEYDMNSVFVFKGKEILVASDGTGRSEEADINDGILEIYVWNSTFLESSTNKKVFRYNSAYISMVPGINMDNMSKLKGVLSSTVQTFDILINKSTPISDLINKEVALTHFLNTSLTVGEFIDTSYINDIIKSDDITTLKEVMEMSESIQIIIDGALTLMHVLNISVSLERVFDSYLPVSQVMNATSKIGLPLNDSIFFNEFINNSFTLDKIINKTALIKESFKYFAFLNDSIELEDVFINGSLFFLMREIYKSYNIINDKINAFETSVNVLVESTKYLNVSYLQEDNQTEETAQFLEYFENFNRTVDTIKNMVHPLKESAASLCFCNRTLKKLLNETQQVSLLTNKTFECLSNISGLLDQMIELISREQTLTDFGILNGLFENSFAQCSFLKTKVDKLLADTTEFYNIFTKDNAEKRQIFSHEGSTEIDIPILDLIGTRVTLGDLLNPSIYLEDILNISVSLRELEITGNKVWTYLDKNLLISDILNDHGNTATVVEILIQSDLTKYQALQPNHHVPMMISDLDNILVRAFVSDFRYDLWTTGTGTLQWYEHMVMQTPCHFGGMVSGLTSGGLEIWHSKKYPECSTLCQEPPGCDEGHDCERKDINSTLLHPKYISKIWVIEKDYCSSSPCKHDGNCVNLPKSFKCNCKLGWNGIFCENNINDCTGQCNHSIQCIDKINDYTCVCENGWTGKNCSLVSRPFRVLPINKGVKRASKHDDNSISAQMKGNESTFEIDDVGSLVILGTKDFDLPNFSIIKSRYSCTKFVHAIDIKDRLVPMSVSVTVDLLVTNCNSHSLSCSILWGDGSKEYLNVLYTVVTLNHTYLNNGVYEIQTECIDGYGTVTRCPETKCCMETNNVLDDSYKTFHKPKRFLADKTFEINSYVDARKSYTGAEYHWRFVQVSANKLMPFTDFNQTHSSNLVLPGGTLRPGTYVAILEVVLEGFWYNDFIVLEVSLPDLYTVIMGGDFLYVPRGEIVQVNASESRDPVGDLNYLDSSDLVSSWTFELISSETPDNTIYSLMNKQIAGVGERFEIQTGNVNVLEIFTGYFPVNTYGVAIFTMSKGNRFSRAYQVLKFVKNALPVTISCIYNCNASHGGLINFDKLTLEAKIETVLNEISFKYHWNVYTWTENRLVRIDGVESDSPSMTIMKNKVLEAKTYIFEVTVSTADSKLKSSVAVIRTFDYVPHGGSCEIDKDNVVSAFDLVTLKCWSWSTRSGRLTTNNVIDNNPILTYTVLQKTDGAFTEEEPVTQRDDREFYTILKLGNPERNYQTSIVIRIADVYNNFNEFHIPNIVSRPVFNLFGVDTTESGTQVIRAYIRGSYSDILNYVLSFKRPVLTAYYISAVCSNLHLIELVEKEPVVPNLLNEGGNGIILDLSKYGNSTVTNMEDTLKDTLNKTLHPTIVTLQEFLKNMTDIVTEISTNLTEQQEIVVDKMVFSVLTNSFSNLASKAEFLDKATKSRLVHVFESTGTKNVDTDNVNELQEVADQTFKMSMAISDASVFKSLDQYRPTDDIRSAMRQIDDMLSVVGADLNIYTAAISPEERALIYLKMQRQLYLFIDEVKENAKSAAHSSVGLAKDIQDKLPQCQECDNQASGTDKQLLKKTNACKFRDEMTLTKTSAFVLDGIDSHDNKSCDHTQVSVSAFEFKDNVYMYDNDGSSSLLTSSVLRLDVKTSERRVSAKYITFKQNVITPNLVHTVPHVYEEDASKFMYHKFLYHKQTDSVCIVVKPVGDQGHKSYLIYLKFNGPPSIIDYDIKLRVFEDKHWQSCVDPHRMKGHTGVTYLAISFQGINMSKADPENVQRNIVTQAEGESSDYFIAIATMGCLTWDEGRSLWDALKCQLTDWLRDEGKIVCLCRDVTDMVFGNSFFVAPNAIDFSSVFLKFSPLNQAAVIGTLAGIFTLYFVSVIFLARLDRRDKLKWAVTPLRDNYLTDEYFYVIRVVTGMRRGAGTRSHVAFQLSGEYEISGHRELFDGIREEFGTGSVMTFIMSTYEDLGDLLNLHIWHDNTGEGNYASWYLNQVDVYDIQRQITYSFPFETWLSVETCLEAKLSPIPKNHSLNLESRFFGNLRQRISEGHMFISILYRPAMSVFTRVQRASCALVFVMLSMLGNALYFNPEPDYQTPAWLQIGPFRFTSQQVYISIFCALFTTIPVCFLNELFKRTKRKQDTTNKKCCSCYRPCHRCRSGDKYKHKTRQRSKHKEALNSASSMMESAMSGYKLQLPHGFIYVAWLIVAGGTITPAFFVLLYSMEWGKQKSEEWLTTLTMSLLESMLLIDPFIVICLSLLLAVILRSRTLRGKDSTASETVTKYRQSLGENDYTVSSSFAVLKSIVSEFKSYTLKPRFVSTPVQGDNFKRVQEEHRQYTNFLNSVKDIKFNLVFIILVKSESIVATRWTQNCTTEAVIKGPNDLFKWLNDTMIPYLFRERDEYGMVLHWTKRQFTQDHYLRLGPPRLRQLRTKRDSCDIPYSGRTSCFGGYYLWSEEDNNFCIRWNNYPCNLSETVYNVTSSAWKFTSSLDVWGFPLTGYYTTYGGGGYIASLNINLNYSIATIDELYKNLWIDRQTRAVIMEFTLYDASTNLFIYNMFMIEFPETGGVFTTYTTYPLRVYPHHGPAGTWTLICEILFVFYIICFLIRICLRIYRLRFEYFKMFWSVYDLVIFGVAVTAMVLFYFRLQFSSQTIEKFKQDMKLFVNFSHIVVWDQAFVLSLGMLSFLVTVRMLEVLSTLKHLKSIVDIFRKCGKDLFWYGLSFIQIFTGFCALGLLLFGSQLESYRNVYQCMGTLFIAMIGKSRFTEINETNPVLAKVFFMLYILVVVYFFLTIFLAILGASIDEVVQQNRTSPEHDIVAYLIKKIKDLFSNPKRKMKKQRRKIKTVPM